MSDSETAALDTEIITIPPMDEVDTEVDKPPEQPSERTLHSAEKNACPKCNSYVRRDKMARHQRTKRCMNGATVKTIDTSQTGNRDILAHIIVLINHLLKTTPQ